MAVVSGDRYLESLLKFVENNAEQLIEGTLVLKLNPVGLRYVQSRLEALEELESLLKGAPVDYLRAYVSDLGDHRALEQLRRIMRRLPALKVISVVPPPAREPTSISLLHFGRLRFLELRGCDLSTCAARGLLELRHTLEKFICHNSTDALRHVFASRILEIKKSPFWTRLTYVSCAFNGLVLMDESLQLLPSLETLDISSNKFTKVDNLRKCSKLKHLDLGFNHLRTISYFSEVPRQIVKLVLRNNALTALRGIENLKFLEGLDVTYNIISNFSEMEILAGIPSLQNLLLEGNPLCCARWYRAQVFSYFPFPENLRLDGKKMSMRESWKRQVILTSRQKRPSSFGFYSPAIDAAVKDTNNFKRKKISRLVSIESENQSAYLFSDQDSGSCDHETQSKEENALSDEEGEIVELMNRIELMKKERSAQWLQDIRQWMDPAAPNFPDGRKCACDGLNGYLDIHRNTDEQMCENSRCTVDAVLASVKNGSIRNFEDDVDSSLVQNAETSFGQIGQASSRSDVGQVSGRARNLHRGFAFPGGFSVKDTLPGASEAIDNVGESRASSVTQGSPPHYREHILRHRRSMEEELLHLSSRSFSAASSDSNTSCSEDDSSEFQSSVLQVDETMIEKFAERSGDDFSLVYPLDNVHDLDNNLSQIEPNGALTSNEQNEGTYLKDGSKPGNFPSSAGARVPAGVVDGEAENFVKQDSGLSNKRKHRKHKKRIVSLSDDSSTRLESLNVNDSDANPDTVTNNMKDVGRVVCHHSGNAKSADDIILDLVHSNFADIKVSESSKECVHCWCLLQGKFGGSERDVAIFLSSESKLCVLQVRSESDGSVVNIQLIGCHASGDISEVIVGLGLQIFRICCKETSYLFIARSIESSRKLLYMLDAADLSVVRSNRLKSVEQIQVDILQKEVFGGSKPSIFLYSLVLLWNNNLPEDQWLSRSIFVLKQHLLICKEDLKQFEYLSEHTSPPSYFSVDSWCSIVNISEMVIDANETQCVTLTLNCSATAPTTSASKFCGLFEASSFLKSTTSSALLKWKLKWLSEEGLHKFVALLKALHSEVTTSALPVSYII